MALDGEGAVVRLPDGGPRGVEPPRLVRHALLVVLVPDPGDELAQLGAHHPHVQIVGLQIKDSLDSTYIWFGKSSQNILTITRLE